MAIAAAIMLNFNPPSPWGEGHIDLAIPNNIEAFQSTLPVWGGTKSSGPAEHSLPYFNPPSPVWGGTDHFLRCFVRVVISIHPPREGRDRMAR